MIRSFYEKSRQRVRYRGASRGGLHGPRHSIARCHLDQLSVRWARVDSSLDVCVLMANLLSPPVGVFCSRVGSLAAKRQT
jgi:hypothetical protein